MSNTQTLYINDSASSSRIGGRADNQDNYGTTNTPFGQIFVVCDGMGGGPGGSTASTMAVNTYIQYVVDADESQQCSDVMYQAAVAANEALQQAMVENAELNGMGTTIVAITFTPDAAVVAHVGDSRLYQLHDGKVLFRTNDHSFVAEMVRRGTITEDQARLSSQSNLITRALGAGTEHEAEIDTIPYSQGDRIVLCTDGVWGSMPEKELIECFSEKKSLEDLVEEISAKVDEIGIEKGGHHDNHTLTMIDVCSSSILRPEKISKMTRIKNAIKKIF